MVGETSFDRKAADWLSNREETAVKAAFGPTMLLLYIPMQSLISCGL